MIRSPSAVSSARQPPPGEIATTLFARPRLAISSDSAPPIELPAKCASPTPCSSSSVSRWLAASSVECAGPAGGGGPPAWPCSVGASTSKRGAGGGGAGGGGGGAAPPPPRGRGGGKSGGRRRGAPPSPAR